MRFLQNRRLRPWLALTGLAAAALLAVGMDVWLVNAGPQVAFRPADAQWTVEAANVGEAWRRLAQSQAYRHWREAAGDPVLPLQRSLGQGLGLRPTPLRTRVYLGKHISVSGGAEGIGFSCRPGIVLRALSAAHALSTPEQPGGLYVLYGWTYAWREGQLIASRAPGYVRAALAAPPCKREPGLAQEEMALRWHTDPKGACRVRFEDGFPITGWFDAVLEAPEQPLGTLGGWPEPPILTASASSLAGLETLGRTFAAAAGFSAAVDYIESQWQGVRVRWQWQPLPPGWDASIRQATAALHPFDAEAVAPLPQASLTLVPQTPPAGPHPLAPAVAAMDPIAMHWAHGPGLLVPIMGEPLGLCLGRTGVLWLTTTRERLIRQMAAGLSLRGEIRGSAAFHLNWAAAAEAGMLAATQAQSWGLLAQSDGLSPAPWKRHMEAVRGLGFCRLTVLPGKGVSRFEGVLAASEPAE